MKKIIVFPWIASLLLTTGCATILSSGKKSIRFESEPPGASVQINGIDVGKTPCQVMVKRKFSDQEIQIRLKGYNTRNFGLEKSMNKIMWLDALGLIAFIFPGVVFIIVDLATGHAVDYDRSFYNIELEKKD